MTTAHGTNPTSEPSSLEERLARLEARFHEREAQTAIEKEYLETKLAKVTARYERLQVEYEKLRRRLFGKSSEKLDPNQLPLGFTPPAPQDEKGAQPVLEQSPIPIEQTTLKKKGHGRRKPPAALERRREEIRPDASLLVCACGQHKVQIGEETHELLARVPATYYVRVIARPKFACPKGCEASVVCAAPPPLPIEKGLPDASVLAHVLTAKYSDHLPLHRIATIMKREGAVVPVSTLSGWVNLGTGLLEAVVDHVAATIAKGSYVRLDETGLRVLDRSAPDGTRNARVWAYLGETGDVYFVHSLTKANDDPDGPAHVLRDFRGYAQADAYNGFDQLYRSGAIVEVACWAHGRRKFFEAQDSSPDALWALNEGDSAPL